MQRAKDPFVTLTEGVYRLIQKGEEFEEDDTLVEANPGLFETCQHAHLPTSSGEPTTTDKRKPGSK
jgi:hypothetical protein